jgi:predicted dehydrogenase
MEYFMIKLGIVGAGAIIPYHLQAARLVGIMPTAICAKEGSTRAQHVADSNQDLSFKYDINELLESDIDAIVIAVPTVETVSVLKQCLVRKVPILVEKPVSINAVDFETLLKLDSELVQVGYNRRHYSSVRKFKSNLESLGKGIINVDIAELSLAGEISDNMINESLLTNSVHMFDLIHFLFGQIVLSNRKLVACENGGKIQTTQFENASGIIGNINLFFGVPENYSMTFSTRSHYQELRPIEEFRENSRMKLIEPNLERHYKVYSKDYKSWNINSDDLVTKPGFLSQYLEFKDRITGDISSQSVSANLFDAARANALAREFLV